MCFTKRTYMEKKNNNIPWMQILKLQVLQIQLPIGQIYKQKGKY